MSYGEYTDEITCPYCGSEWSDSWEVDSGAEDLDLLECEECGKQFYCTRNVEITYTSREATYGTCNHCKTNNVVVEDYTSSVGKYTCLCVSCGQIEELRLMQEYSNTLVVGGC